MSKRDLFIASDIIKGLNTASALSDALQPAALRAAAAMSPASELASAVHLQNVSGIASAIHDERLRITATQDLVGVIGAGVEATRWSDALQPASLHAAAVMSPSSELASAVQMQHVSGIASAIQGEHLALTATKTVTGVVGATGIALASNALQPAASLHAAAVMSPSSELASAVQMQHVSGVASAIQGEHLALTATKTVTGVVGAAGFTALSIGANRTLLADSISQQFKVAAEYHSQFERLGSLATQAALVDSYTKAFAAVDVVTRALVEERGIDFDTATLFAAAARSVVPLCATLDVLSTHRALGILAAFDDPDIRGLLASVAGTRRKRVDAAALLREPPSDATTVLVVPGNIRCWICRERLVLADLRLQPERVGKWRADVDIFPVCPTCFDRATNEPGYFDRHFQRYERSRTITAVIEGGKKGDRIAMGKLRLVQSNDDDNDP